MVLKVLTAVVLLFGMCIAADKTGASLTPEDSVIKIGGEVQFKCRSPHGYTSEKYEPIVFKLEHNGTKIVQKDYSDGIKENHTEIHHTIHGLRKQDAGTYTCHVIPAGGQKVSVTTHLYVVEADNKTNFVKEHSHTEISCLVVNDLDFQPVIRWFVNGNLVGRDFPLKSNKAEIEDASKNITCAITSDTAFKSSMEAAIKHGTAAVFQKKLSVFNVTNCNKVPCQHKVSVYGNTPVNITWIGTGTVSSSLKREDNVTTSITEFLNSTEPVMLIITGGHNTWSGNITIGPGEKPPDEEDGGVDGGLVAGIVVAVALILLLVFVVIYCCIKRKRNQAGNTSRSNIDDPHDANETAEAINLEQREPLQENGQ